MGKVSYGQSRKAAMKCMCLCGVIRRGKVKRWKIYTRVRLGKIARQGQTEASVVLVKKRMT